MELIQGKEWFKIHTVGIGFYATVKAVNIKNNKKRFFISTVKEIELKLGKNWKVYPI